jgi:ERCC4-type nuclease
MDLVLDSRETALKAQLNTMGVPCTIQQLGVGDAVVRSSTDGSPRLVFERKTLSDLAASIRDGRYREQSLRLHELPIPNSHVVYVVEGSSTAYTSRYSGVTIDALYSAMCTLGYYKGFTVTRTQSVRETAAYLAACRQKIEKREAGGDVPHALRDRSNDSGPSAQDHVDALGSRPSGHITPEAMPQLMLSQVPGVSAKMACAILQNATFADLVANPRGALDGASYNTPKGQCRRIPKDVVAAVEKYLGNLGGV